MTKICILVFCLNWNCGQLIVITIKRKNIKIGNWIILVSTMDGLMYTKHSKGWYWEYVNLENPIIAVDKRVNKMQTLFPYYCYYLALVYLIQIIVIHFWCLCRTFTTWMIILIFGFPFNGFPPEFSQRNYKKVARR